MARDDTAVPHLRVELRRSRVVLELEYGASILDAIEAAGVEAEWSCRAGICGSCQVDVLAGVVLHRDSWLTDAERAASDVILPCVSWSASETLVLDV